MPSDTPTSAQWRARPVFISSTFKDMQAERDYLRSHVFPRLEEKLRERRHQFEPIDLRMGVETAELGSVEAREALVLKVCLEEIQRDRIAAGQVSYDSVWETLASTQTAE